MEKVTINKSSYSHLFRHCENKYNISWNTCCDIFHGNEVINYRCPTELNLEELQENIGYGWDSKKVEYVKTLSQFKDHIKDIKIKFDMKDLAYYLIGKYLIDNNVENVYLEGVGEN